jgi:hypothetical protein
MLYLIFVMKQAKGEIEPIFDELFELIGVEKVARK